MAVGEVISKTWTVRKKKQNKKKKKPSTREYAKTKREILFKFGKSLGSKRRSK